MNDLARSERDIQSILNNMPDVFYRTDIQSIVTLMSPSVRDVLGYQPEEMISKPLADFYCTPSDREKILTALHEGKVRQNWLKPVLRTRMAQAAGY